MKLKPDESLPRDLADDLAGRGLDIDTVVDEGLRGSADEVVVRAATAEDRMLLVLDRGVGDLRRFPPGSHAGVIVLRPISQDPESIVALSARLLRSGTLDTLAGCVVVIDPQRVRVRRPEHPDN